MVPLVSMLIMYTVVSRSSVLVQLWRAGVYKHVCFAIRSINNKKVFDLVPKRMLIDPRSPCVQPNELDIMHITASLMMHSDQCRFEEMLQKRMVISKMINILIAPTIQKILMTQNL